MEDNKLQLHTLIDYHPYYYLFYYHLTTPCFGAILIDAGIALLLYYHHCREFLDKYYIDFWLRFV